MENGSSQPGTRVAFSSTMLQEYVRCFWMSYSILMSCFGNKTNDIACGIFRHFVRHRLDNFLSMCILQHDGEAGRAIFPSSKKLTLKRTHSPFEFGYQGSWVQLCFLLPCCMDINYPLFTTILIMWGLSALRSGYSDQMANSLARLIDVIYGKWKTMVHNLGLE